MNDWMIIRYAREVCEGKKTMLQVERHLLKTGWSKEEVDDAMQRIAVKVSERKKGNG